MRRGWLEPDAAIKADAARAARKQSRFEKLKYLTLAREALLTCGISRESAILADNAITEAFRNAA